MIEALSSSEKLIFAAAYALANQRWNDRANLINTEISRLQGLPPVADAAMQTLLQPWVAAPGSYPNYNGDQGAWVVTNALMEAIGVIQQARAGAYVLAEWVNHTSGLEGYYEIVEDLFTIPTP